MRFYQKEGRKVDFLSSGKGPKVFGNQNLSIPPTYGRREGGFKDHGALGTPFINFIYKRAPSGALFLLFDSNFKSNIIILLS